VNTDYGPGLGYRETSGHGRYVGGVESMIPALEKIAAFNPPKLPQMELSPGPLLVLTDNADEPGEKRLATGVTVTYDPPANWIKDNPAPPSKLFNIGSDNVVPASVVGTFGPPDGVWDITIDLHKEYEIDRADVWLRSLIPVYVDVLTSVDGNEFQKVDQILPANQIGWFRTRDLGAEARYVRLSMVTLDNVGRHLIHQVKVWGGNSHRNPEWGLERGRPYANWLRPHSTRHRTVTAALPPWGIVAGSHANHPAARELGCCRHDYLLLLRCCKV
jgi:hypothetical protein